MKYVLMYTSRPDLDADTDPELAKAVYARVYDLRGRSIPTLLTQPGL